MDKWRSHVAEVGRFYGCEEYNSSVIVLILVFFFAYPNLVVLSHILHFQHFTFFFTFTNESSNFFVFIACCMRETMGWFPFH